MSQVRIKPRLPKGMRDFLPQDMLRREYVFSIVRDVFHLYGFEPLQTPVMELNETLMGKYGEDAEKLIYRAAHAEGKEELALRYDLTVPLARVVAQYQNEITLPFRRYQIAPVWRGERPQRGRYREFYQCDADIVGVSSMSADAEVLSMVVMALTRLGFRQFTVKINNRKLLTAIGQFSGVPDALLGDLYRSIDKFDKIGAEGVREELLKRGIGVDVVERMLPLLQAQMPGLERLDFLDDMLGSLPAAREAIAELRELADHLSDLNVSLQHYEFDLTMVRGLGYYTGPIFETVITEPNLGSVSGGGRYDALIGMFRGESIPTTGVSLGIERIIDLMELLDLYPASLGGTVVEVLVTVFNPELHSESTQLAALLRAHNIRTELYMLDKGVGKQLGYADKKGVPLVALLGPDEQAAGVVKLKRLSDGLEISVPQAEVVERVRQLLAER
ncbi:MAG: histidine--tRNA ligase [Chloroflexota bacterium]|mgnify:CR=1 FL=1